MIILRFRGLRIERSESSSPVPPVEWRPPLGTHTCVMRGHTQTKLYSSADLEAISSKNNNKIIKIIASLNNPGNKMKFQVTQNL